MHSVQGVWNPPFQNQPPLSNISPFLKIIEPPILRGNFVVTGRQEMEFFFELDPSRWLKSLSWGGKNTGNEGNLWVVKYGKHENG